MPLPCMIGNWISRREIFRKQGRPLAARAGAEGARVAGAGACP